MAYDIASITKGTRNRPPRIILHGIEKIGKSTFASQFPNPVFLPICGEEGIDALDVASFPTINSFADLLSAMGSLAEEPHDHQTVVIDSISALEPLIWKHVCAQNGWKDIEAAGFGKGYIAALDAWHQLQNCLDHLRSHKGMASVLIGHVVVRQASDPMTEPYDKYELDLNKKASAKLKRWSDSILFCNRKTFVREKDAGFNKKVAVASGGDVPKLYTKNRPAHDGGGRGVYGQLPYELDLNYQSFADAVSASINQVKGAK